MASTPRSAEYWTERNALVDALRVANEAAGGLSGASEFGQDEKPTAVKLARDALDAFDKANGGEPIKAP